MALIVETINGRSELESFLLSFVTPCPIGHLSGGTARTELLVAQSIQVLENKDTIQSIPVSHVNVRKGGGSDGQKIMFAAFVLPRFIRK